MVKVTLTVNGQPVQRQVPENLLLADFLRHELALTGTHLACEHGVCGACTVLLDGRAVRSCLLFTVQAEGGAVTTVEGLAEGDRLHPLQQAFLDHHALQCGFCTPGMLMTGCDLLQRRQGLSEADVRAEMSANLCRCTGYQGIVRAVLQADQQRCKGGEQP